MSDDREVIDVEAVEIEGIDNLPAIQASTASGLHSDRHGPPQWSEEWWKRASPEVQAHRCVAHKRDGNRCLKAAIKGATVCRTHGGATRHIRNAARVRLENAADLMAKQLLGIALTAEGESVKLAAIRDALDRAGLKAPSEVVLSQGEPKKFEAVFDSIGGDPEAAGFSSVASEDDSTAAVDSALPAMVDPADQNREPSSDTGPLGEAQCRENDRDTQPQARQSARSQDTPARPETHITGMAAMQIANAANREAGVFDQQRAIESPHKRYRRP